MTPHVRATVAATAYMLLGALIAIAVLAPQLVVARRRVDRLTVDRHLLEVRCVFTAEGGASCPAGTFSLDGGMER